MNQKQKLVPPLPKTRRGEGGRRGISSFFSLTITRPYFQRFDFCPSSEMFQSHVVDGALKLRLALGVSWRVYLLIKESLIQLQRVPRLVPHSLDWPLLEVTSNHSHTFHTSLHFISFSL